MSRIVKRETQHGEAILEKGKKYKHLTKEEMSLLHNINQDSKKKMYWYSSFVNKYPDLKILESELNSNFNLKIGSYSHRYIIRLIELDRINVSLECLMRLRITTNDFRNRANQYIDGNEIIEIENFAIVKLKYKEETIKKSVIPCLIRVILHYKIEIGQVLEKSNDYMDELDELVSKGMISKNHLSRFKTLCKILNHKYIKFNSANITSSIKASKSLENKHEQLINDIDNFAKWMKLYYSNKYIRTTMSHIRQFLNFLYYNFLEIDHLEKISNEHIVEFIRNQKKIINEKGKKNSNVTINHRLEAVDRMLCYFSDNEIYDIQENLITIYEKLAESKKYTKYYSEEEILKLFKTIFDYECINEELQFKLALIILVDTARRQAEVLNLSFDCLRENKIYFHRKHHNAKWVLVGENSIYAVKKLQEMIDGINLPLFSELDNDKCRRLFTSLSKNGNAIISSETLYKYFQKIQIENDIVDSVGKAKYTLHDIKRSAVTTMINEGMSIELIAEYLNQNINSLLPYEVNNQIAIKTLKSVEKKGLLMGKGYINDSNINHNNIISRLNDMDLIQRNKNNLIYKINNPKEGFPLFFGYCTDNSNFNVCSDLICLSCEEFYTDSIDNYNEYALKIYKFIYSYKRDARVKDIAKKVDASLEYTYINNVELSKFGEFKTIINKIKKQARKEIDDEK